MTTMGAEGMPMRLSELSRKINDVLDKAFRTATFWVIADITNHGFKADKNYHHFELVEKSRESNELIAKISGKAWGRGAAKIEDFEKLTGQKFSNNIQVLVNVAVDFHSVYGLQINLIDIDPNFTLGVLEQQKQFTLQKLVAENAFIQASGDRYITRNNQLKLPAVIQNIAMISSANSAGAEDFRHTLENNLYGYHFDLDFYFTEVQGEANASSFLKKIIEVFNSGKAYDVLVITRGGGSQTDLLIFDNYQIGRALAKFPIPVITGIGHQKNETIADLMVHTATKTPTKASEFIISHNRAFEEKIAVFQRMIIIRSQQLFSKNFRSLSLCSGMIVNHSRTLVSRNNDFLIRANQVTIHGSRALLYTSQMALLNTGSRFISGPRILINNQMNDINNRKSHLKVFTRRFIKSSGDQLLHHISIIKIMSPVNILKKGFAIVKVNGRVTSHASDIQVGEELEIILDKSQIQTTVRKKTKYNGSEFNL